MLLSKQIGERLYYLISILDGIIEDHDYVAVLFTGLCADDEDKDRCHKVVENLERIDTYLDEHGIVFVMTPQLEKARQLWLSRFPGTYYTVNSVNCSK